MSSGPKDEIQSARIICKGGLNTSENFLLLSDEAQGSATRLVNYETSTAGGYRRINGYSILDPAFSEVTSVGTPASGPVLGVWVYVALDGTATTIAARKTQGSSVYKFYEYSPGVGWIVMPTGDVRSSVGVIKVRAEIFSTQTQNLITFVDGVNNAIIYDGTTWYPLDSGNAGGTGSPGGNQVIDSPALVAFFKDTLFLGYDSSVPSVGAYSNPGDPFSFTAAGGGGQFNASFPIMQMKSFRDELFIFGMNRIRKAIPDLASGFVLQEVTNNIGCIARDSVVEIGGNLIFLSKDGIRPVAGTDRIADVELSTISQSIQNTIDTVTDIKNLDLLNSVTIRGKTQFRYFFSDPLEDRDESYGIIGALRVYGQDHLWEFGELMGIRASCSWSGMVNDEEIVLHGDYDGIVYRQESGNSFAGDDIFAVYTLPYLDFGSTSVRKTLRRVDTFIRAEGTFTLNYSIHYDWERQDVQNPGNYTASSSGNSIQYDGGAQYDGGSVYGGATQPVFNLNIQGSGYAVQLSLVTTGVFSPYTIQGVVMEYTTRGRQ